VRGRLTVRLPAITAAADAADATPVTAPRTLRVLLVDDNRNAVEMLAEGLREAGLEVTVAYDGPEALKRAAESPPDVAVLGVGLPLMDGYELATRLRQARAGSALRLVAMTGYGQESDRERSREVGFDLHLVKPVEFDTVLRAIRVD
jgi:CheY-like chemotaxis protein